MNGHDTDDRDIIIFAQNDLQEFYSIVDFCNPSILGKYRESYLGRWGLSEGEGYLGMYMGGKTLGDVGMDEVTMRK